jgi:4-carboxymuconolactone decarboxylase
MNAPEPREPTEPERDRAKPVNLLSIFSNHTALARAFLLLQSQVLMATSLSQRHRELLALRTAVRCSCGYEWIRQVFVGREGALDDEEVFRIAFGADASFWSDLEATLLRAADELVSDDEIGEATRGDLASELDSEQVLDLILTVRTYETLALMMRSVGLQPDDELRRLGEH